MLAILFFLTYLFPTNASPMPSSNSIPTSDAASTAVNVVVDATQQVDQHYDPLHIDNQYNRILKELEELMDGSLEDLKYIRAIKDESALRAAAKIGDVDMVKHLVQVKNVEIHLKVLYTAARYGNLEVLKYILSKRGDLDHTFNILMLIGAIKSQKLDVIRYVHDLLKRSLKSSDTKEVRKQFWYFMARDDEPDLLRESLSKDGIHSILAVFLGKNWNNPKDHKLKDNVKVKSLPDLLEELMTNVNWEKYYYQSQNQPLVESHEEEDQSHAPKSSDVDEMMGEDADLLVRLLQDQETTNPEELKSLLLKGYLYAATKYGKEDWFIYLVDQKEVTLDINLLNYASSHGQLFIVRYLIEKQGIEPTSDTVLSALSSRNSNLIRYLFYNKQMIADDDVLVELELALRRRCDHEKFSDCISELNQVNQPLKSALRNSKKQGEKRHVDINLENNEEYFVEKYIEKSLVHEKPVRRKKQNKQIDQKKQNAAIPFFQRLLGYVIPVMESARPVVGEAIESSPISVRRGKRERLM